MLRYLSGIAGLYSAVFFFSGHGTPCGRVVSNRWMWQSMMGIFVAALDGKVSAAPAAAPTNDLRFTRVFYLYFF